MNELNIKPKFPFQDKNLSRDERVTDLINRLSLEEKFDQLMHVNPLVERLQLSEYEWWNEGLHGVARAGRATVFPQAIAMAATFSPTLIHKVATAVSDEAIEKHQATKKQKYGGRYGGLSFWTPNINIFRDPRWGRGHETWGEDPHLTSTMAVNYMKGLQGNDPEHLKVSACAKHFAVHSGPEAERHSFNAKATKKDLFESYLPAFKTLVHEGVEAIMCAYNRTNDEPCCGSPFLIGDILRGRWGFKGHVVSDCWALRNLHTKHGITQNPVESAAYSIKNGVDLNCGDTFHYLPQALEQGLITEKDIDTALRRVLNTKCKLGLLDSPEEQVFSVKKVLDCAEHRQLALEVAQQSIILLKNNGILPLSKNIQKLYITGPNATNVEPLLGNYYGMSSRMVTVLEGIAAVVSDATIVDYRQGCLYNQSNPNPINWAINDTEKADATIAVMGLSGLLEGEEGEAILSEHVGDKSDISLPESQIKYLKNIKAASNKPLIVVILAGSPLDLSIVHEIADAVVFAWYPGEEGGTAIADVLFENVSPSGKLPVTFPKNINDIPAYNDYRMKGRTYRYLQHEPLYPFGFGLSYTKMELSTLNVSPQRIKQNGTINIEVKLTNKTNVASYEVVQVYVHCLGSYHDQPHHSLKAFQRVFVEANKTVDVEFKLQAEIFMIFDDAGAEIWPRSAFSVFVATSSPTERAIELGACQFLKEIIVLE